jgi:hypothetical protein
MWLCGNIAATDSSCASIITRDTKVLDIAPQGDVYIWMLECIADS